MSCKLYNSVVSICICLISVSSLYGGITGTISGTVLDQETGQVLPGAAIIVEGTTMWAMADKNGHYLIQNLPAGTYDVSATMIGYSKLTKKDVQINVDLNTDLDFELTTKVLPLEEVVVTEKRELIHSEITSSTYFISGQEINDKFPIDSYRQAISLLPGVVGDHFRGGRETEVTYMLDGLPIQGVLSREISSYFPNSSIVEMMVQTGGYTAEYGQASSGIVNVVTKDGGNEVEGDVKIYSDLFDTGFTNNDNTRRLEVNVGGPLTIGLGGPVINANYFVSADLNLSDTPHRNQMREVFDSPIFSNYNINSKLSLDISNNTLLTLQGLVSNWNWRRFDPQWELNLNGLAEHRHNSHRISASLTHTFSPKFFGSLRVGNYSYKRSVMGSVEEEQPNLIFEDSSDPKSLIIAGDQPWDEETKEDVGIIKLDFVGQLTQNHLLKTGIEIQDYQATSKALRFDYLLSTKGADNSIAFNKLTSNYEYSPKVYSLYAQDKFGFHGITANLGLRYDIFSPRVTLNPLPDNFVELRSRLNGPVSATDSENHTPLSPRLGISIPLSDNERLHANYGWYYQLPPLYYYYVNNSHNVDSYLPIISNVDLEPMKTISSEFSYKRVVAEDLLFVITGFTKQFNNLVDTQTFLFPDSVIASGTRPVGFSKYTNSAFGRATGFEVTLQKRLTPRLWGRVSYTYMKAKGTSSTAEDGFNLAVNGVRSTPTEQEIEFPLSWDQRHSLIIDLDYETQLLQFNVLYRLFSPLPFTTPGSDVPNNARRSWRNILDLKVKLRPHPFLGGTLNPFFEIRNILNQKNLINQPDDSGVRAYRLFDPINSHFGRRLRVGMTLSF